MAWQEIPDRGPKYHPDEDADEVPYCKRHRVYHELTADGYKCKLCIERSIAIGGLTSQIYRLTKHNAVDKRELMASLKRAKRVIQTQC